MVLEVGGRGAAGFRIIRNAWAVIICMVLEVGGRGAAGFRIIKEMHRTVFIFKYLEMGGRGADHTQCIGLSLFSWFWEWAGWKRLASES